MKFEKVHLLVKYSLANLSKLWRATAFRLFTNLDRTTKHRKTWGPFFKTYYRFCRLLHFKHVFWAFKTPFFEINIIPLQAKRVADLASRGVYWNQAQKNVTHPYTEYPWVSVALSLCKSEAIFLNDPYLCKSIFLT